VAENRKPIAIGNFDLMNDNRRMPWGNESSLITRHLHGEKFWQDVFDDPGSRSRGVGSEGYIPAWTPRSCRTDFNDAAVPLQLCKVQLCAAEAGFLLPFAFTNQLSPIRECSGSQVASRRLIEPNNRCPPAFCLDAFAPGRNWFFSQFGASTGVEPVTVRLTA
jgi:hypothetical protein